jgi:hypothetical protein
MTLTCDFKRTIQARVRRDAAFRTLRAVGEVVELSFPLLAEFQELQP